MKLVRAEDVYWKKRMYLKGVNNLTKALFRNEKVSNGVVIYIGRKIVSDYEGNLRIKNETVLYFMLVEQAGLLGDQVGNPQFGFTHPAYKLRVSNLDYPFAKYFFNLKGILNI